MGYPIKVLSQPPYFAACDADLDTYMNQPMRHEFGSATLIPIPSMSEALHRVSTTANLRPRDRKIINIERGPVDPQPPVGFDRAILFRHTKTVVLQGDDANYQMAIHKEILVERSAFFESLLSQHDFQKITLTNVDTFALRLVLRFLYDDSIQFPETLLKSFNDLTKLMQIRDMDKIKIYTKKDWYTHRVQRINYLQGFDMQNIPAFDLKNEIVKKLNNVLIGVKNNSLQVISELKNYIVDEEAEEETQCKNCSGRDKETREENEHSVTIIELEDETPKSKIELQLNEAIEQVEKMKLYHIRAAEIYHVPHQLLRRELDKRKFEWKKVTHEKFKEMEAELEGLEKILYRRKTRILRRLCFPGFV